MPNSVQPITKRIVCISGFTQSKAKPNGVEKLWMRIRAKHDGGNCRVSYFAWDFDASGFIQHCIRTAQGESIDFRVVAYSWGVGKGFVELAEAAWIEAIDIRYAVLSDGVYYSRLGIWRSVWSPVLGEPTITIPPNVGEVWFMRQNKNKPAGHIIRPTPDSETKINDYGLLGFKHQAMDDAPEFHKLAINMANRK